MFLQAINEFEAAFAIKAVSPVLIKDGRYSQEVRATSGGANPVTMPNVIPISRNTLNEIKNCVRDPDPLASCEQKLTFYIPGSSLRGAWRCHLERILRSEHPDQPRVCDPFADDGPYRSCSDALEKGAVQLRDRGIHPYRASCPICRLFGSTAQASRIHISDGIRRTGQHEGKLVERQHVRISRRTGQVAPNSAPLRFFGLQDSVFNVTLRVRNYEARQICLLAKVFQELEAERIPLGSGASKGYGRVKGFFNTMKFTHFGAQPADQCLRGVAEDLQRDAFVHQRYGLPVLANAPQLPEPWTADSTAPWRWTRSTSYASLKQACSEMWPDIWKDVGLLAERVPPGQPEAQL